MRPNIDRMKNDGFSPLMMAIVNNDIKEVERILTIDCDCNYKNYRQQTVLDIALKWGSDAVLEKLLKQEKIQINYAKHNYTYQSMTPFMYACQHRNNFVCSLFLQRKDLYLHAKDKNGYGVEAYCLNTGKYKIIEIIKEKLREEEKEKEEKYKKEIVNAIYINKIALANICAKYNLKRSDFKKLDPKLMKE